MTTKYPPLYYSDYLKLDSLLGAQCPKSEQLGGNLAHDEVLFIIVHQAYELWFKQILHELDSVAAIFSQEPVDEDDMAVSVSRLGRVIEIQKVLVAQLSILDTMTPLDFLEFRDYLVPASGFQSFQFRMIENKLGLQKSQRKLFEKRPYHARLSGKHREMILRAESEPSLFSLVEHWLERTPFLNVDGFDFWENFQGAVARGFENDRTIIESNPMLSDEAKQSELQELDKNEEDFLALFDEAKYLLLVKKGVRRLSYRATQAALLITLFRDEPILQMPFRFLSSLVEIDDLFTTWRYRHSIMVQRMIGQKVGTGGSSGQKYLKMTADSHRIFADLTNLSTFLIPRSQLPELPREFRRNLGFYYTWKGK